jgi:hypothetical protein
MKAYHFCPLTGKECLESRCGWWLDIDGFGGCAIRCLGGLLELVETAKNGIRVGGTLTYQR